MKTRRRPTPKKTQREIASAAGISRRTVQIYKKCGVDVQSIAAIRRHQRGLRHNGILPGQAARSPDLAAAKLALLRAKADKAEIEADNLRSSLIDIAEVRRELRLIVATVTAELLALADTLPALLAGREPAEMAVEISVSTDRLLHRLADPASYRHVGNSA